MAPRRALAVAASAAALLTACVLFLVGGDSSFANATVLLSLWPSWGGWGQAQPSPGFVFPAVRPAGAAQPAGPASSRFARYLSQARLAAKYAAGQGARSAFQSPESVPANPGVVTGSMPFWGTHVGAAGAATVFSHPGPVMVSPSSAQWTQPAAMVPQVVSGPVWTPATMHPVAARWDAARRMRPLQPGARMLRQQQPLQPVMRRYIRQPPPTMRISVTPGKNSSTPANVVVAHGLGDPLLVKPTVTVQESHGTEKEIKGLTGKMERMDLIGAPPFFFFTLVTGPRRSLSLKLSDYMSSRVAYHIPVKENQCPQTPNPKTQSSQLNSDSSILDPKPRTLNPAP